MKLSPQQQAIVDLLRDHQWHTNTELNAICYRYGGRIHELRNMGYIIDGERVDNHGLWRFRLLAMPASQMVRKAARRPRPVVASSGGAVARDTAEQGHLL